jgi:hypothetical protein
MPTVNIYVTQELKDLMAQHNLNWSKLAGEAFQRAIDIDRQKITPTVPVDASASPGPKVAGVSDSDRELIRKVIRKHREVLMRLKDR